MYPYLNLRVLERCSLSQTNIPIACGAKLYACVACEQRFWLRENWGEIKKGKGGGRGRGSAFPLVFVFCSRPNFRATRHSTSLARERLLRKANIPKAMPTLHEAIRLLTRISLWQICAKFTSFNNTIFLPNREICPFNFREMICQTLYVLYRSWTVTVLHATETRYLHSSTFSIASFPI